MTSAQPADRLALAYIFDRQWLHLLLLLMLLGGLGPAVRADAFRVGALFGLATPVWMALAVILAITHQGYVWFCWRMELHASLLTRCFGDRAFPLYASGFAILVLSRLTTVVVLAAANRNTVPLDVSALRILAVVTAVPVVYLFYSVQRYFTFRRALGLDHFDSSYRSRPLVNQGIFRFTRNGMYVFGLLIAWLPGLWYASAAGLLLALFNHAYVWVHYVATERPDMKRIYPGLAGTPPPAA